MAMSSIMSSSTSGLPMLCKGYVARRIQLAELLEAESLFSQLFVSDAALVYIK